MRCGRLPLFVDLVDQSGDQNGAGEPANKVDKVHVAQGWKNCLQLYGAAC